MAAGAVTTGFVEIPTQKLDAWLGKVKHGSTVAALSPSIPMKFGAGKSMTFDIGEAEYVGAGQNKGATEVTKSSQTVDPFKFHKTIRFDEEVQWADEDHQLEVLDQILEQIQPALSRALDYGIIHGINPTGGTAVAAMTQKLSAATSVITRGTGKPYVELDAADAAVLANGFVPSDVALDPAFAAAFTALRGTNSEQRLYPNFRLSTDVSELDGHNASVSKTVSATGVAAAATNLLGIVGVVGAGWFGVGGC